MATPDHADLTLTSNADALEERVWTEIADVLKRPDLLTKRFQDSEGGDTLDKDLKNAERDLAKWEKKNERLIGIYVGGDISKEEFDHQRKYVQEPLEAAQDRVRKLKEMVEHHQDNQDLMARFLSASQDYIKDLERLDGEGRSRVLHEVIESATLDSNNNPTYSLRVPRAPKIYASSAEMEKDGVSIPPSASAWT